MASLEKIKICGIRSFGPSEQDMQTIHFLKPVTLILGENGCGKSTIIECLRYLTAQKEPAGKGTFVHDPSLAGKAIIRGFVKLQITDCGGNRIDLCRQLQATRTKKTLTTKSLDNVITRTNRVTKEKQSISNRCADFSYEITRIFGVSRAILENVIFCTQEDSQWPLETDQKLKEKFDQIFDSDKYNKCVGKVREKIKKLKENVKLAETELKYLESNKQSATQKRREIAKTKGSIEECERDVTQLTNSLLPIDHKLKSINEKEMEMNKNHTLKETKKIEMAETEKYIAELKKRIGTEFTGPDSELKYVLDNFSKLLLSKQEEISQLEGKVNNCNRQEAKLSRELMQEQGKLGQLQKEEEINKERLSERNKNVRSLAVHLDIEGFELSQAAEDSVQFVISKIESEIKRREEEVKSLRKSHAKEESEIQSAVDKLTERSMSAKNEVANKERSIKEKQAEMTKLKKQLTEIDESTSKLSKLESQLSQADKIIEELQNKVNPDEIKRDIQANLGDRNATEDRLTEVEETIKVFQQNAAVSAELDIQRDLISKKDSDICRLINKHEDSLRSLLGDVPENNFKAAIQNHMEGLRRRIRELSTSQARKEKEFTELDTKRKHQKEQLRLKEETLRSFEEEIYNEIRGDDLDETVSALQSQIDELQDIRGTLSSSEHMFQRYIRALRKPKPCCPLCHRDFTRQDDSQILVEELTSKIQEVPHKLEENKSVLEEKQSKFNKLLLMRTKNDEVTALRNRELPGMRSEQESTESNLKKLRKEIDDVANQVLPIQTDEAICSSMQGDMALLDQLQMEKRKIQRDIDKLESNFGNFNRKGNLEEMFDEQETLRKRLKATRKDLEELQKKLSDYNEELQVQQANKNSLMELLNKIQGASGRKKELSDGYSELQALEVVQLEELDVLRDQLEEANRSLQDTVLRRNMQRSKNSDEIDKLSQSLSGFQKQFQNIQSANDHVKAYEGKGVTKKLEAAQKCMKKIESDIGSLRTEREEAARAIEEFKGDVSNQQSKERELADNLQLREKARGLEVLRKEVAALEAKCGDMNFDSILREKRKLKAEEESIERQKAVLQGRIGELHVRLEQLSKELSSKMYRTVDADYQKQLVNSFVQGQCAKDLERYGTTMEYAMMKYHKKQMARVNSFIKEYWMRIYQGNDIDYIEIQTDSIENTEKRRNYNYKVVQIKGDTRLDLRNRCSAGQKMLASLIIRMALAETFSGNCGILTLDEPTTNLDRKNIRNLAATLKEILTTKQNFINTNFQLIVITHDEQFLRELMDIDVVSEYVLVKRNRKGLTRVSREMMDGSMPKISEFNRSDEREHVVEYD